MPTLRVLRSRTMAIIDGENPVNESEIVEADDDKALSDVGNHGNGVFKLDHSSNATGGDVKRRQRPPNVKIESSRTAEVKNLSDGGRERAGNSVKRLKVDSESENVSGDEGELKELRRRGPARAAKVLVEKKKIVKVDDKNSGNRVKRVKVDLEIRNVNGDEGQMQEAAEKKIVQRKSNVDDKKDAHRVKRVKVDLESGKMSQELENVVHCEGEEKGLRVERKLVKNQIIDMLAKAGWTVEYRPRQSRDYKDAVYVAPDGKTNWSCTKAYKMLKDRVEGGKATDIEVNAYAPIPALSSLFRVTKKGKKVAKKNSPNVTTMKSVSKRQLSKGKSVKQNVESRNDCVGGQNLAARNTKDGSYKLYKGRRSLLSWIVDMGTVPLGGKVKYRKGRTKLNVFEGKITKHGIRCFCCDKTYMIREFESHAESDLGNPYENMIFDSRKSLLECLVETWKKSIDTDKIEFIHVDVDGDDPNDDRCNVCGDGGDLICCDSCPSVFHDACLGIKTPPENWHCIYCSCKFCGDNGLESSLSTCFLCEERFHVDCGENKDSTKTHVFCGNDCQNISEQLQALIGVRHELEKGFFFMVLQHRNVDLNASFHDNPHEFSKLETNSKLAVAYSVMDECFKPCIDEFSKTNIIHDVIFNCGSNIRRLNYSKFFTVILERGEEVVSVASIRFHGKKLAEMPFVGTRDTYRRQGMCRRLLDGIDKVLVSLGVEKLVLPAIRSAYDAWKDGFGFSSINQSERQEIKCMSLVVFPKVEMLQKKSSLQSGKCTVNGGEDESVLEKSSNTSSDAKDAMSQ